MGSAIGEILPLAIGVAISPIPIIAAVLMLLSPRAKSTGVGFAAGWVVGILVVVVIFTLLASIIPQGDADDPKPISGTIKIILGVLLLLLAIRQWRSRPAAGEEPGMPKWMGAIDSMTAIRGFVLGLLLSGPNPKNLLMGVGAGVAIGSTGLTVGESIVVIVVYTVLAALTVLVPVIAYLVASERMAGPLGVLRTWLVHNNATVMAVLLLVIGVVVIGKGLGNF